MEGRLFLVDGTALAYRSHFAFINNPLTTSDGRPTSAAYGFVSALLRILRNEEPEYMAVAFDRPEPTFRKKRYPAYKATREKAPEEMVGQFPVIKEMTEALGIAVLEKAGFEADDLIGTATRRAEADGLAVFIVSGDKDMMQLVSKTTRLYDISKPGRDPVVVGADGVEKKFGVPPDKLIDVLGLMGDASDNVPGVPLVGPKKASALVNEWGSLEEVLAHAGEGKPSKTKQNLIDFADQARLSKELVTLDTDVSIDLQYEKLHPGTRNSPRLVELFTEYEFTNLLDEVRDELAHEVAQGGHRVLVTDEEIDALIEKLERAERFVLDVQTSSDDPYTADLVGLAFSHKAGEASYVPCLGDALRLERLRPLLEDASVAKAGHDMKFDAQVLRTHGVEVANIAFDTMIASFLLDSGRGAQSVTALALKHLGIKMKSREDLVGKGKDALSMAEVPGEEVAAYAAGVADCAFRLMELFAPRLKADGLVDLFERIEMPLVRVLADMECAGVRIDSDYLVGMGAELEELAHRSAEEIQEIAGERFNVNSTKQLGPILFEKLQIQKGSKKRVRRTKTGYSTDARALESYADHPIVAKILAYREVAKLKSTYVDALPQLVHRKTGRIHSTFNQTGAATGRLSSNDPNLQNIPVRTELGRRIRKAFIADEGCVLLCADYNQIELRLMAHFSGDPGLCDVFARGGDVHTETAARMFGCDPKDVTRDQRGRAKAINFGILYGMGPQRIARDWKITLGEAKDFLEAYFSEFPRVREFQKNTVEHAREEGYVTTLLGRRRVISEILSEMSGVRVSAENMAMNSPLQGTAADLIKLAMVNVHRRMRDGDMGARMILQVHDELVFEVPDSETDALATMVKHEMEHALELDVPIVVDIGCGLNWLAAH
jgi:DNA polymerase-1